MLEQRRLSSGDHCADVFVPLPGDDGDRGLCRIIGDRRELDLACPGLSDVFVSHAMCLLSCDHTARQCSPGVFVICTGVPPELETT
jgi:hypothetical protein